MILNLQNISKSFSISHDAPARIVLNDMNFKMEEGDSVAILGPSGSGKTTMLNLIGTLDRPDSGKIFFRDKNIVDFKPRELDAFRNQEIGFVFQFHHLLPQCSVLENVLIPTLVLDDRDEKKQKYALAEKLLKRVGIWDHKDKLPGKLSGGECQRAAVVRAMINNPSILLADEPTGALDKENVGIIADLLMDLNKNEGLSLLVVTHSQELASRMNKTYELVQGKPVLK
ncbi:MAG: ABC transporter ATP-binding protein [Bacteroidales bacterium]|nr:ABC transporter ATP-binding protein [Bacteroidales bacterium]MCF8390045.1 ABC transporter ATP-binding protein [Bacteroidales bacterium]